LRVDIQSTQGVSASPASRCGAKSATWPAFPGESDYTGKVGHGRLYVAAR
jgi:hypothetical protein